ncbi:MAG: glycosyltransferase [Ferruginibacter sp.]
MSTGIISSRSATELNIKPSIHNRLHAHQNAIVHPEIKLAEVLFITSFPPRECGIATYSKDLIDALNNKFDKSFNCSICALESSNEQHEYLSQPKFILNTDQPNAFEKTAVEINKDDAIKLIVIQHEFGFYASKETAFKLFYESINKPIVFVFHTVLPKPNEALRINVQNMARFASSVIVMTNDAANILKVDYNIASTKISVIPHGTHLVPPIEKNH